MEYVEWVLKLIVVLGVFVLQWMFVVLYIEVEVILNRVVLMVVVIWECFGRLEICVGFLFGVIIMDFLGQLFIVLGWFIEVCYYFLVFEYFVGVDVFIFGQVVYVEFFIFWYVYYFGQYFVGFEVGYVFVFLEWVYYGVQGGFQCFGFFVC